LVLQPMPLMESSKNRNALFWVSAVTIGTLLNGSLFFVLPNLGRTDPVPKPEIISVEFMAWQQPASKPPSQPKPIMKKKLKPKPKKKPKPKPKKKSEPKAKPPEPVKKPVLTEKTTPEKTAPIPPPVIPPEIEPEPESVVTAKETNEPAEDVLPVPAPIFKLTSMPRIIHQSPLIYPPMMREQGAEAQVTLGILLDLKGKVRKITVIKSGGEAFDNAAIESMRASSFLPGNINGKPVAVLLKKKIRFRLQ